MNDMTPRFALPLLAAGQAQKEVFHNEALTLLDALVQPVAQTMGEAAPPPDPQPGQCWIVGDAPTAAWDGQTGKLATWTQGGWRFVVPVEGMAMWVAATGLVARRTGGVWVPGVAAVARLTIGGVQVVGARRPAIANPSGGTVIDAAARDSLGRILDALRAHGLIET